MAISVVFTSGVFNSGTIHNSNIDPNYKNMLLWYHKTKWWQQQFKCTLFHSVTHAEGNGGGGAWGMQGRFLSTQNE